MMASMTDDGWNGDALTTPGGAVWLGFFDEAQSSGQRMIVRLDDRLQAQWGYPYATERADLPPVNDVETTTTDGEGVVCHVWHTHHLLRADGDEVTDLGPTGLFMVRAVLVQGGRGAFVGGQPVGGRRGEGRRGADVVPRSTWSRTAWSSSPRSPAW